MRIKLYQFCLVDNLLKKIGHKENHRRKVYKMITKIFFLVRKTIVLPGISLLALTACNVNSKKSNDNTDNSDTSKIVKIGVLHSLSGTMAISEVSLKDAVQMAVDEINASGGVLGRQIEPIIVDPASDWDLFSEKARELLVEDKVAAVFGCWTSVSRKSVLPVFEQNNGLLFYPVQYEGEESSKNIVYSGAVPNQQLIPAADYLMSAEGGGYKRFYLLGTDYIFPRTANKILKEYLLSKGVPKENIIEEYTPFHYQDYQLIVSEIKQFAVVGKSCVLSTINGDSNIAFYTEFANQGLTATTCPIMAFSVAEDELRTMDTEFLVDHLAAWNYYQSIDIPENKKFVANFKAYCHKHNLQDDDERVTDDPICWAYTDVYLWAKAAEKAQSFDVAKVVEALKGLSFDSPAGLVKMDDNNHLEKTAMIGEIKPDGQFNVIWKSDSLIVPQPFFKLEN
jgi:urea transport system substrate-binding protein